MQVRRTGFWAVRTCLGGGLMFVPLQVTVVGRTVFDADAAAEVMDGFRTDADGGQALAEAAGRSCYGSFGKPNPTTATNAGYLAHILDVGHGSVLEHSSVSLYVQGVSRSLTHELVRHRHLSYSQLSQRYVPDSGRLVMPPDLEDVSDADADLWEAYENANEVYQRLTENVTAKLGSQPMTKTARRKRARQAARAVLPNMAETKIVVTGNYRAWREVIALRATEHADTEIRRFAVAVLRVMQKEAPNVFADFEVFTLDDGTSAARLRR